MSIKTYDPAKVSLIIGGHIVKGYADGTFISAERNSDNFTRVGGADGEQTRAKSNDKSGVFTFTLLQSSLSNAVLQGYATADETSNSGLVTVLVKDANGSEKVTAATAWVQKPAAKEHGKELSDRVWTVETGNMVYAGGGIENATA